MRRRKMLCFWLMVVLLLILAGCGGSGSDSTSDADTTGLNQGVVVDPYISGAILQELSSDGRTVLQRVSTPSDAQGHFEFSNDVQVGSIIETKISQLGLHSGEANKVVLRRKVRSNDDGVLIVSPFTTLVANGSTDAEVVGILQTAGINDFTEEDIYIDPMGGLDNITSNVADPRLSRLQAAMAIGNYLEVKDNQKVTASDLNSSSEFEILTTCLDMVQETLDPNLFNQLISNQNGNALTMLEFINAAVTYNRSVIAMMKQQLDSNGAIDSSALQQKAMEESQNMMNELAGQTQGPGAPDGATLYADNCAACHGVLADTDILGRSPDAIQTAIDQNIGGMGIYSSMTAEEVQAIADTLPPLQPTDPSQPVDGTALYSNMCATCHGTLANTDIQGNTAASVQTAIDQNIGNMGFLSSLTTEEVQAIADILPGAAPVDPTQPIDGVSLYATSCSGCHGAIDSSNIQGRAAGDIQTAIDQNIGNMNYLSSLTTEEVQAISDAMPASTPVDPTQPVSGSALYSSECSGCHGAIDSTNIQNRTPDAIQAAIDQNIGNMNFLNTLTTEEIQAISDALPVAAPVDPTQPVDGATLYSNSCSGCHGAIDSTDIQDRTPDAIQAAIDQNIGNMNFLNTLTTEDVQAISDALPAAAPVDPTQPIDGANLYATSCSGCHGAIDNSNIQRRTSGSIQAAIDQNIGNMNFLNTLTTEEVQAIADAMPASNGSSGPDYSDCTACHAQPPNGTTEPNTDGAHSAHQAIASIGNDCQICHTDASHNGSVDLGFTADFNSGYGDATDNLDGTCSNISCHGGNTTPDWWSGSIDLTRDCVSCHDSSAGEYISQTSGEHSKHRRYSCTDCHNSSRMPSHIGDLVTNNFEVSPASTVGGNGTRVGSYSNGSCSSIACHGSERWR